MEIQLLLSLGKVNVQTTDQNSELKTTYIDLQDTKSASESLIKDYKSIVNLYPNQDIGYVIGINNSKIREYIDKILIEV